MHQNTPTPHPRILIIGLDAADPVYMQPWIQAGRLPNLARLMERGACLPLRSTLLNHTIVAWPTLYTGKNPGKTGNLDIVLRQQGSYRTVPANLAGMRTEPLWAYLGEQGLRTLAINIPVTYPPHPLHGRLTTGFDTPAGAPAFAWPPDFQARLEAEGYRDDVLAVQERLVQWCEVQRRSVTPAEFLQGCRELNQSLLRHAVRELAAEQWDAMFIVSHLPDLVNHYTTDMETIGRVYELADEMVGTLMAAVPKDTTVVVASDHGSMQSGRCVSLIGILLAGGFTAFKPELAEDVIPWIVRAIVPRSLNSRLRQQSVGEKWRALPVWLRRALSWLPLRLYPGWAHYYSNIDWPNTKAYVASAIKTIYINRRDVLPQGTVDPGALYEDVCAAIVSHFESVVDPLTGQPVFRAHRVGEVWHGPFIDELAPDLIVTPRDDVYFIQQADPRGRVFWDEAPAALGGLHRYEGLLALAGPRIRPGSAPTGAEMVDVLPTLLYLLGLPLPRTLDGKVLAEAIDPEYLRDSPPVYEAFSRPETFRPAESGYTEEEAENVMEKLRALGYVD